MNYKSIASNAMVAFAAQGVALVLSVIQSLLVPKLLGVTEFGYWQLFLFYANYVGLFHFGLNDGVYLREGGNTRDGIDKRSVISQFCLGIVFEVVISVAIIAISVINDDLDENRRFVIAATGLYLVIQNAATYLSYVLQAMNETKRSSYSLIVERLSFLMPLLVLLIIRDTSFEPFVMAYVFSSVMQLIFCLRFFGDFFAQGFNPVRKTLSEARESIRVGSKLMFANLASMLILGVARAIIDMRWGVATFGKLSLALSLASFFLAFVSQASMVLFPALRQGNDQDIKKFFGAACSLMSLILPGVYILYFPAVTILGMWLPEYAESLIYFAYLLPICVFDSKMDVACTTLFKVRREEKVLLGVNVATAVLGSAACAISAFIFDSVFALVLCMGASIVGRSVWSERYLRNQLNLKDAGGGMTIAELCLTVVFLLSVALLDTIPAFAVYMACYILMVVRYRSALAELMSKMKKVL